MDQQYKLSDQFMIHLAKSIQMAILTGTDLVDHMRMMTVEVADNKIQLTADFVENFDAGVNRLLEETTKLNNDKDSQLPLNFEP